jgi:mono/diheme cytochrome c family protein
MIAAPPAPIDTARIEQGITVYRENYCGTCHTLSIANTRGTFGPAHDDAITAASQYITLDTYNGDARTAEAYIRESIIDPAAFYTPGYEATNHHMPAFSHLSDADIEAMVYMLIHQDSAHRPDPD